MKTETVTAACAAIALAALPSPGFAQKDSEFVPPKGGPSVDCINVHADNIDGNVLRLARNTCDKRITLYYCWEDEANPEGNCGQGSYGPEGGSFYTAYRKIWPNERIILQGWRIEDRPYKAKVIYGFCEGHRRPSPGGKTREYICE